jgi:hypothetical protein
MWCLDEAQNAGLSYDSDIYEEKEIKLPNVELLEREELQAMMC